MSKPKDPPRLFDASSDTTDAVRAVLRAGQRELPGPSDLARLAARLPLAPLPPPGASPPGASPPAGAPQAASLPPSPPLAPGHLTAAAADLSAAAAGPSVASSALLGALLGLGVVGGVWWRDAATAPRDARPSAVASAAGPSVAAPTPTAPGPAEPGLDGAGHAGTEAGRGAPREPSSATAPRDELPPRASAGTPRDEQAAIPSPGAPSGGARPSASPPSSGAAEEAAGATEEAETEVQLLHRAQDALATDAGSALALTTEHARRFPAGALGQEREIIAIRALLALGRAAEARARAASLLERFPGSAYRGRLESLGLEDTPPKN
ncbi:hypothetical protein AB3662_26385 [Sorangium cellulosum]|uniref:hypothetical protein n=1 Tax=Sorangium cellulosum TaxID=56 RepID=UPI003D9A43F5